jgi:hypothetical protein
MAASTSNSSTAGVSSSRVVNDLVGPDASTNVDTTVVKASKGKRIVGIFGSGGNVNVSLINATLDETCKTLTIYWQVTGTPPSTYQVSITVVEVSDGS